MKEVNVILLGQPNVGKSSLLDSLVGSKAVVSNYPGTTVELTKAKRTVGDTEITFIDTPGIYSISDRSEEEKITEERLLKEDIDGAVVLADATSLERSLYMVLQVLEAKIPTVVALNFVEEAKRKGIEINCDKLESILGVPVVKINPIKRKGLTNFLDKARDIKKFGENTYEVEYDDHIEKAIGDLSTHIQSDLPLRFVGLRVLEGDKDFYRYLDRREVVKEVKERLEEHPKIAKDISVTRYGTASFIAEKVISLGKVSKKFDLSDKLDEILLDRIWGPLTTGLSLLLIFGLLLVLGRITQDFLMGWTERLIGLLGGGESILYVILNQGLTGLMAGVSIALPYVFLFYLLLGLLEDIGILPRFIINVHRLFKKIGLPAKAFIPLALGLGCTAPATRAARVLPDKETQFEAVSLFPFVPCSSRIAIIMGIVGFFGGIWLAILVFTTMLMLGGFWAISAEAFSERESEPLLLELPPYRSPLISNVLTKSWIRMKDFVYVVIPFLALGGIAYGLLNHLGLTGTIVRPLSPITRWLGLPSAAIIPLVFGFLQKDLTGAMLVSVLSVDGSVGLSQIQLYVFGVASVVGIPCIIALGTLWREFGLLKSVGLTIVSIGYGYLMAGVIGKLFYLISA